MIFHEPSRTRMRLAAASVLAVYVLGGCVGPAREPAGSVSEVSSGETLVVGQVELVPPLRKDEQVIKGFGSGRFKDKLIVLTGEQHHIFAKEPGPSDYAGRIEAILGKPFFVRSSRKPFFILGGMLYLSIGGADTSRVYFPGGWKVSINPGDKAVYIGTLQYHRNEFFDITKVVVIDDYERANAEFKKKFGVTFPLRKSLLAAVK